MMSWQVIIVVTNEQISSIYQFEKTEFAHFPMKVNLDNIYGIITNL